MEAPRKARFFVVMGRQIRQQCPGSAFHVTARTQGRAHWFVDALRPEIGRIIVDGIRSSGALLLAWCVMPNHFHIVLRQGTRPLGRVMQPIVRRIALLVQRAHVVEGHVFERRFRSSLCDNADYLRRALAYTHNNPRRGGLCDDLAAYEWSSHLRYAMEDGVGVTAIEVVHALRLFASSPDDSISEMRHSYLQYMDWRLNKDDHDALEIPYAVLEPDMPAGDRHFMDFFQSMEITPRKLPDLRDRATRLLANIDRSIHVNALRGSYLRRRLYEVREQLIAALLQQGYHGSRVAEFLLVSDTTVSTIAGKMRNSFQPKP